MGTGIKITSIEVHDVRFPTSRSGAGSDAMNPDPDYSATYVIIKTDASSGLEGHGLTFTIGRGNEICVAAVHALAPLLADADLDDLFGDMGATWRRLTSDSQLRWLGPEKGVVHMATAAVVNALWDLYSKRENKPLWRLIADLSPEQFVDLVDFTYLTDVLTRDDALDILIQAKAGRAEREQHLLNVGYPAYTTSAGWSGYSDEELRLRCREGLSQGWTAFKLKVGRDPEENRRRAAIMRSEIGPEASLMMDANQCWDVPEAIANVRELSAFNPLWIEEPTSPDDILGHAAIARAVAPVAVATGEVAHNRVMFKQLLQAGAIGFCQIDSARLGGVNEVLAVLLLAAKFGIPVCPHAGGVGLCEYVQHLAIIDYLCVSASLEGRMIEYVDHLHEHFINPVSIKRGTYQVPTSPGYSIQMFAQSIADHTYPHGKAWQA